MKTTTILAAMAAAALFTTPLLAQEKAETTSPAYEVEYQIPESHKDFRIAFGGGYAFRLGKIEKTGDPGIDDLNKQLRHGFNIDADAQYFFKESWGLGLNANYCGSSTSGNNITLPDMDQPVSSYEETQSMLYFGPSFVGRNEFSQFLLVSSVGFGPLFYMDNITVNGVSGMGNKTTLGFNAGLAGEYKLNTKTGIGLKLSYTIGSINSLNFEGQNLESEETMSISNLMTTVFLSFRSW